ncbi:class I SAM-dependent methyltransferase [Nocardia sp. NBC_00565]|uniref:class I SAM-dependent methyltransferase n=1 Tax=Nocardia sp. NBC_00565 TaxID=2975993 RepID=UPI002E803915|nr:class I SAM-dependent methyltransferase [Nocardia sp. NBC_00565]WUC04983.1 class I SAM-dependent methyltransferase [Nocardia sp. NBC_00565]
MDIDDGPDPLLANRGNWDVRAPIHAASRFYRDRDSSYWFAPFEWDILGDVRDRDVLHLQCHLGTETIEFAERGATAVGLDFSPASIAHAREIASDTVEYVCADVYDAPNAVGHRHFDIVYTGKGALCYLPDLPRWANILAELLRPGGLVYIVEFHPLLHSLGPTPPAGVDPDSLVLHDDYLEGRGAQRRDSDHTYTDGPALTTDTTVYEWRHGLGEVINALIGAGLHITDLTETEMLPWPRWSHMIPTDNGWFRLPPTDPILPLLYGLAATKPD